MLHNTKNNLEKNERQPLLSSARSLMGRKLQENKSYHFHDLPKDIILYIMTFLDSKSLYNLSRVDKKNHALFLTIKILINLNPREEITYDNILETFRIYLHKQKDKKNTVQKLQTTRKLYEVLRCTPCSVGCEYTPMFVCSGNAGIGAGVPIALKTAPYLGGTFSTFVGFMSGILCTSAVLILWCAYHDKIKENETILLQKENQLQNEVIPEPPKPHIMRM